MKKVLILSPNLDQALAVARFIRRYSKGAILYGGLLEGEKFEVRGYYDKMLRIRSVRDLEGYDYVLPTGARSTYWMATHIGDFLLNDIPYAKENLQYFNKIDLLSRVTALGISAPKTFERIDAIDVSYPIFYKPGFEKGGGPRGVIYSPKDLERVPKKHELIFQEYIPSGTTYGVGFIAKDNKILTSFQHEELLSLPIQGGSAVYIRRFNDERLLNYTKKIIQNLGFSGWGLAEFKYCPRRRDYVFMEINAKLWASIEFTLLNNNKFLKYLFDIDHPEIRIEDALYIERFIALGLPECLRNSHYLLRSKKIIRYRNPKKLLAIFARGILSIVSNFSKKPFPKVGLSWQT
jgi:hypothetical protein